MLVGAADVPAAIACVPKLRVGGAGKTTYKRRASPTKTIAITAMNKATYATLLDPTFLEMLFAVAANFESIAIYPPGEDIEGEPAIGDDAAVGEYDSIYSRSSFYVHTMHMMHSMYA